METTSFECTRCGQWMAVGAGQLGQQVQCPHCHAVVQAPGPVNASAAVAPVSPPEPAFTMPPAAELEDIFTPADAAASDDLFGFPPPSPVVEMPSPGAPPARPLEVVDSRPAGGETRPASPPLDSTVTFVTDDLGPATPAVLPTSPVHSEEGGAAVPSFLAGEHTSESLPEARPPTRRPEKQSTLGPMLLIFLIPYAITTTGFIAWQIYSQNKTTFDPLERLPDPKPGSGGAKRIHPHSPLPQKLKTSLGQSLRVGDLEVIPLRVDMDGQGRLGLHLRLRNESRDVAFNPLLPDEFYRFQRLGMVDNGPYSYLEAGGKRLYALGAELEKKPPRKNDDLFDGMLRPGEELVAVLRTRSDDKGIIRAAGAGRSALLWRVHLRRGLVAVRDAEVSATAVVGIEFGAAAIGKEPGAVAGVSRLVTHSWLSPADG